MILYNLQPLGGRDGEEMEEREETMARGEAKTPWEGRGEADCGDKQQDKDTRSTTEACRWG